MRAYPVILALTLCLSVFAFSEPKPELLSVAKIWDNAPHNAFTDLIRFNGAWYCTFREAEDHVGGDGVIRVITSTDGATWQSAATIAETGIDLRDPKLSITPENKLMMLAGGSVYNGGTKILGMQPRVSFSENGTTWSPTQRIMGEGDWLWRVTWHKDTAYGVSYGEGKMKLLKSRNGVQYELIAELAAPGDCNETTLRFTDDNTVIALVRRDANAENALIGQSKAPFTQWTWKDCGERVGGPNFIQTPDRKFWASGRDYNNGDDTVLARMTLDAYTPALHLPSGGDTSYPGMVWHEGLLYLSYYSTHEGKTSIYLAKIKLDE